MYSSSTSKRQSTDGRKTASPSEWTLRRQVAIARFIVDFLAPAQRLVVEVDGGYHARRVVADERRERVLRRLGSRVLRLSAEMVVSAPEQALANIVALLK